MCIRDRKEDILHADETTVQVLKEPGRASRTNSYMWLYRKMCIRDRNIPKAPETLLTRLNSLSPVFAVCIEMKYSTACSEATSELSALRTRCV